jgi:hypothetical protein
VRWLAKPAVWLAVLLSCPASHATGQDLTPIPENESTPQQDFLAGAVEQPCRVWTIDYRVRSLFNSNTCYEFGVPEWYTDAYAPLSRLNWALDSMWTGVQFGLHEPDWDLSLEWLTPMERNIHGTIQDDDWDEDGLSNRSYSPERWTDGQMLDLRGNVRIGESLFGLPVDMWGTVGFRFQRFHIMAHDTENVFPDYYTIPGDVCTFNQQYYIGYIGGELRTSLEFPALGRSIDITFQGDWGATNGFNVDHHLTYEPWNHRFTTEKTRGSTTHLALIAETQLTRRFSLGLQADYMLIHTTGSHRWTMTGASNVDETWSNGVIVGSEQNSVTAFVRASF